MLTVDQVSQAFERVQALDHASFTAEPGQVTAIVGPNGAGKTTPFSILAGVLDPDAGTCLLDGDDLAARRPRDVGYLASEPFYYERLSGRQTLGLHRSMRGIDVSDAHLWELLEQWDAADYAGEPLRELSQGMRKRVLMACAFLGDPALLILDEPLNGLDVQGVMLLKDQIAQAARRGCHVLLCTHLLDFIQGYADKTLFLRQGRIVGEFGPDQESLEEAYREIFMSGR